MSSLIDQYRRKYWHQLGNKTDEEIALALGAANPELLKMDAGLARVHNRAKSLNLLDSGVIFDADQVRNLNALENKVRADINLPKKFELWDEPFVQRVAGRKAEPDYIGKEALEAYTDAVKSAGRSVLSGTQSYAQTLGDSVDRGTMLAKQSLLVGFDLHKSGDDVIGNMDAARQIAAIEREKGKLHVSEDLKAYYESDGFLDALGILVQNPFDVVLPAAVESLSAQIGVGVLGGYDSKGRYQPGKILQGAALGAGTGFVVGPIGVGTGTAGGIYAGMGLTSHSLTATSTYLNSIQNEIGKEGKSIQDPEALLAAINDPKVRDSARKTAMIHGLTVGAFDAFSAGIAGGGRNILWNKNTAAPRLAAVPVRKSTVWATELAGQGALGMTGEGLGQILSGQEFRWNEVLLEAFAEIPTHVAQAGVGQIWKYGREGKVDLQDRIQREGLAKQLKERQEQGIPIEQIWDEIDNTDYFYLAVNQGVNEQVLKDKYKEFASDIYNAEPEEFAEQFELTEAESAELAEEFYNDGIILGIYDKDQSPDHSKPKGWIAFRGDGVKTSRRKAFEWMEENLAPDGKGIGLLKGGGKVRVMAPFLTEEHMAELVKSIPEMSSPDISAPSTYTQTEAPLAETPEVEDVVVKTPQPIETEEQRAFRIAKLKAEDGVQDAQFELSQMYQYGRGTEKNEAEAKRWLEISKGNIALKEEFAKPAPTEPETWEDYYELLPKKFRKHVDSRRTPKGKLETAKRLYELHTKQLAEAEYVSEAAPEEKTRTPERIKNHEKAARTQLNQSEGLERLSHAFLLTKNPRFKFTSDEFRDEINEIIKQAEEEGYEFEDMVGKYHIDTMTANAEFKNATEENSHLRKTDKEHAVIAGQTSAKISKDGKLVNVPKLKVVVFNERGKDEAAFAKRKEEAAKAEPEATPAEEPAYEPPLDDNIPFSRKRKRSSDGLSAELFQEKYPGSKEEFLKWREIHKAAFDEFALLDSGLQQK